ncbi:H(+)/Cl(-) exchange transporter ClcA [Opitutus sp. ER46]|uniref:H(+)/Cl(-) exchange transporter ClcA n=1 Tax=Opitutus sp. ER46 TaxID=2161864 RepID=UPI000D312FF5|nr:H(+)/Cl(-) exchange transporter ClcA [Opitutus sp. ER46]PTY00110.1 H(+)/Cl(-) exchange transporter ClcA [Opitutus sp. ER46]
MQNDTGFGLGTQEVRRRHILPKALVVGVVAGLLASAFRLALVTAERARVEFLLPLPFSSRLPVAIAFCVAGGALGVWLVRRFAPDASGSGIPQIKGFIAGDRGIEWRRMVPVKFFGGLAGIGGGLALGREGPTIQLGGATGLMVSEWFRVKPGEGERKALIAAGAGAGLAAAFNAPLAGVMFVLEELAGSFTPVVFVAAFLASVVADMVARLLTGDLPVFALHAMPVPDLRTVPAALVLGLACGLGGVFFNRCVMTSLNLYGRLRWPGWAVGALAGLLVGIASGIYPPVAGMGGTLTQQALAGEIALRWLPALLVARFAMTMVSYGSGAAGGIFAPLLVLGALGGLAFGHGVHALLPSLAAHPAAFAVLGMGGLLTAIVRAPLTALVMMIELTGRYEFMLPLLVCSLAAYGVAEWLRDVPIYEALRLRAKRLATENR